MADERSWKKYQLDELLEYEQPTPFIVESTDYNDAYSIPVLTAGKSFIIGKTNERTGIYTDLPVIIFDDFTTATQFVNFPFKVKSSAMKILSANTKLILPKFAYHLMQTIKCEHSTHKRYWIQEYSQIRLSVPSLPEQDRIVARIEELFSDLDKGVETLQTIKAQLKVYRQAVLKEAFEGKLTSEWRETNEDATWKTVLIDTLLVKNGKSMTTGPFGTALRKEEHQKQGIPVLGIESIDNGKFVDGNRIFVSNDKANQLSSFRLYTGDIIISRSGTVGELCVVPERANESLLSTNLIRLSLDKKLILPEFFVYLFQSKGVVHDQIKEICKGSTRLFINQTILKKITFPLPTINEQKLIILMLESRLSVCDKIEQTVDESLAKAESLRQSILKKAFEGRL